MTNVNLAKRRAKSTHSVRRADLNAGPVSGQPVGKEILAVGGDIDHIVNAGLVSGRKLDQTSGSELFDAVPEL